MRGVEAGWNRIQDKQAALPLLSKLHKNSFFFPSSLACLVFGSAPWKEYKRTEGILKAINGIELNVIH